MSFKKGQIKGEREGKEKGSKRGGRKGRKKERCINKHGRKERRMDIGAIST